MYGISDRKVGGLDVQKPDGNVAPVYPGRARRQTCPSRSRASRPAAAASRMHHKFVVIDFDKPTARVYLGSYNFSAPADTRTARTSC